MTAGPLFPSSVVGSMPRSDFVKELIADETIAPDDYARAMDAAVRYIVALQERAGLDVVTDGEWPRKSYIGVISDLAHGFELSTNPADGRPWTVVVERLSPKDPGFVAREITALKRLTSRRVKATLPSPALLGERLWHPDKSASAYPTREAFVEACIPILHREVELLAEARADIVQIDDPHLCLFVDPDVRARYDDPERAADFAVDVVNQVLDGVKGPQLAVHLCRRTGARARGEQEHQGGFGPIVKYINKLRVHALAMEFADASAGDMEVLAKLRDDFEIGFGCVSVTPGQIDSPETVTERVTQALAFVSPERITLNPDCGFAPGSGAAVSIDEAYVKLKNQTAAAEMLRDRYG